MLRVAIVWLMLMHASEGKPAQQGWSILRVLGLPFLEELEMELCIECFVEDESVSSINNDSIVVAWTAMAALK